jgi:hypothetical protein
MLELIPLSYNTEITVTGADGKQKQLWQENRLGKALRRAGHELRIPGITGRKSFVQRSHNLITNAGHAAANAKMSGQGTYGNFVNIAIGTGTTAAAVTDTTLVTEITTGGGARTAATPTRTTTTVTNDTTTLTATFTFSSSFALTEEGIFDSVTPAGSTLLARQVFAAVNVASGDSLTLVHSYSS